MKLDKKYAVLQIQNDGVNHQVIKTTDDLGEAPVPSLIPTAGRIVNYVMKDGQVRPFLIVSATDNAPNGKLFYDCTNDSGNFPNQEPVNIGDGVEQLWSVTYSEEKKPGTWHWPTKA